MALGGGEAERERCLLRLVILHERRRLLHYDTGRCIETGADINILQCYERSCEMH